MKKKQWQKISKYIRGTSHALKVFADEIDEAGCFDKEAIDLLSLIGAELCVNARMYTYLEEDKKKKK